MMQEMLNRIVELATAWSWLVLLATWRALPILVLVAGILLALRRKLSPSLQVLLLTIVLFRLLLPISVSSPLSLHQPIDRWFSTDSAGFVGQAIPLLPLDDVIGPVTDTNDIDTQSSLLPSKIQASSISFSWHEALWASVRLTIVIVSVGMLFRGILSHIRFAMKLQSCRVLDQQRLSDLLLRECDSLTVRRKPLVREVPFLAAPAVFGFLRQTICLPVGMVESTSEQELRWIIRHELAHIRRRDIPVLMLASLAKAVHWFNPVVWLLVNRLRAAMEVAADRMALQSLSQIEASAYGNLLLRLADSSVATKKTPTLGLISFASGDHLKQRIKLLMRVHRPVGSIGRSLLAALVVTVAIVGLTDAGEIQETLPLLHSGFAVDESIPPQQQTSWSDPFAVRESDGTKFIREYDLRSIFVTMPKSIKDSKKSPHEQLTTWLPLSPAIQGQLSVDGTTLSADLTDRQHQLLKEMLEIWKSGEPKQIAIEVRFITTNLETASEIDWVGRRIDGLTVQGVGPAIAARISESDLAEMVRKVSGDHRSNVLFAPKVTLFDGQTAGVSDEVKRPFVTGVDAKPDGRMQPVVSVVDEGLRFVLTPRAGEDHSMSLAFSVRFSSIGKVSYAKLPIKDSGSAESQFTVQVPATEQYEVSSTVKLAKDESIVVAIPRLFSVEPVVNVDTTMIVALTPRIIDTQRPYEATGVKQK